MKDVVVIGAGIAGLTAAHRLQQAGADVHVVDRATVPGGNMRTIQRPGWRHEWGPNSFLGSATSLMALAEELGLKLVPARPVASKRYLVLDGRLQALPSSPLQAITTGVLPFSAKLRALCEPLTASVPDEETSVREFFEKHLGREITDRFVDAFVSGIHAADIAETSMAAAFPRIYEQVRVHKSIVRSIPSMARAGRSPGRRRGTYSFEGGLGALPAAIAQRLGNRLQLGAEVSLKREGSGWRVGDLQTHSVLLAAPSYAAAALLRESAPELAGALETISYNPIAGVHLLYRKAAIPNALDGFGFLIPRREKIRLLGCIWSSSLFDVCAPDHVALTCFIGGAHDREAVALTEEQLTNEVRRDLQRVLGIAEAPIDSSVVRIPRAIPAYGRKHVATRSRIVGLAAQQPGLFLTGNYFEGVSLNDTVAHAEKTAKAALNQSAEGKRAA